MPHNISLILDRDAELTAFKIMCVENPNKTVAQVIADFPFEHINVLNKQANLIVIGHDARRYPHRIPTL
jgi:hypothetical protein